MLHGDLQVFDPIWTTANMTGNHGLLIYDTLFGMDENRTPQPQMVDKWGVSDDKKTYTFTLRAGQKFHDGQDVTSADVVASIRRWAVRDGAAQHMFRRVADTPIKDEKTFQIVLKEPYGLVLEALGKLETNLPVIMRKKDAETDASQQVTTKVGSGAFMFNERETRSGQRYVYDKNPNYVARSEPPSGMAGGKVAKVDRIIIENMADQQTAIAALKSWRNRFLRNAADRPARSARERFEHQARSPAKGRQRGHVPSQLAAPAVRQDRSTSGDAAPDQAGGHPEGGVRQPEILSGLRVVVRLHRADAERREFRLVQGRPEHREGARAVQEGRLRRAARRHPARNERRVHEQCVSAIAQWLKEAGVNAELAASDWGAVITRRAVKRPVAEGGWNIFVTWGSGEGFDNPIGMQAHTANGEAGWFGWPKDDLHEKLRDEWALAATLDERKAVARKLQENAWTYVPMALLGQWAPPVAMRANLRGFLPIPAHVPFWNVEKA